MPSFSALTIALASAAGATFGGGRFWFHSSSIGPGKTLIDADAGRPHLGAQALRERVRRRLRRREGAVRRVVRERVDREQVDPRRGVRRAVGRAALQRRAELLRQAQQAEVVDVHLGLGDVGAAPRGDAEGAVHLGVVDRRCRPCRRSRRRARSPSGRW